MITNRDSIIGFFLRSPDEALTRADAVVRWGTHPDTVNQCLARMTREGLLKRTVQKGSAKSFLYEPTPLLLSLGDAKS